MLSFLFVGLLLHCLIADVLPDVVQPSRQDGGSVEVRKDRAARSNSITRRAVQCTASSLQSSEVCQQKEVPRNCYHAKLLGHTISGVYEIDPRDGLGSFNVYCDMLTDGGGWTVFQRRKDGSVDFYRNWNDYKEGFGESHGEFWLGLDKIHRLSVDVNLRVDLMAFDNSKAYAQYEDFTVGDAASKYVLYFGSYSGTAGDSLGSHSLKGMKFSTKDSDNDKYSANCATAQGHSGWWFNSCQHSNLNGQYVFGGSGQWKYVVWYGFKGLQSLQKCEMKVRNV